MGVPQAKLDRVNSPMGLELNAETPEEIALSILAEIVMLRRGGDGARMGV
jgi:xanthine dehydrogenase accessory factor